MVIPWGLGSCLSYSLPHRKEYNAWHQQALSVQLMNKIFIYVPIDSCAKIDLSTYHLPFYSYLPTWLGGNRGWDGWMASLIQWTWTWANSGRWWGTRRPGVLQSIGSQRVGHDLVTEQQQQPTYQCTPYFSFHRIILVLEDLSGITHFGEFSK